MQHLNEQYAKDYNIILAGDFNSYPESNVIKHFLNPLNANFTKWSNFVNEE